MTPADQDSYRRQFEAHAKRLPRGHVINHCTWRGGHLTVQSAKPERVPARADEQKGRQSLLI